MSGKNLNFQTVEFLIASLMDALLFPGSLVGQKVFFLCG